MKTTNTLYDIREEMTLRGGSFVRALASCIARADDENKERLLNAFPEIIERFDSLATFNKRQQPELEEAQ